LKDLPENLLPSCDPDHLAAGLTLPDIEKQAILQALHRNHGRKVATAKELGIDKNTLRRKMIRHGIRPTAGRP